MTQTFTLNALILGIAVFAALHTYLRLSRLAKKIQSTIKGLCSMEIVVISDECKSCGVNGGIFTKITIDDSEVNCVTVCRECSEETTHEMDVTNE